MTPYLLALTLLAFQAPNSSGPGTPPSSVPAKSKGPSSTTVQPITPATVQPVSSTTTPSGLAVSATDSDILGPGDQIVIRALDFEEIDNKPAVLDSRGYINLPELGRVHAAGLSADQLEAVLEKDLEKYLVHPEVTVTIAEFHSQRVSILGSVNAPGVHLLQGDLTLFEVLSSAGGLRPDAGYTVMITRQVEQGPIPLPTAQSDSTGKFSVASVGIKSILTAAKPEENIRIKPNDVISVPPGEVIYVIGAVTKAGGYMLNDHQSLSALQILSLSEGLTRIAAGDRAKILRSVPGSNDRQEIPLDLKKIMTNKSPDVPLHADDILFVPTSTGKAAGYRTIDIMAASATAFIYRIP